jgi:hypothetical protein
VTLDIGSFERAIARVTEGLARYQQNSADDQLRAIIERNKVVLQSGRSAV